jgi:hypothetical protein
VTDREYSDEEVFALDNRKARPRRESPPDELTDAEAVSVDSTKSPYPSRGHRAADATAGNLGNYAEAALRRGVPMSRVSRTLREEALTRGYGAEDDVIIHASGAPLRDDGLGSRKAFEALSGTTGGYARGTRPKPLGHEFNPYRPPEGLIRGRVGDTEFGPRGALSRPNDTYAAYLETVPHGAYFINADGELEQRETTLGETAAAVLARGAELPANLGVMLGQQGGAIRRAGGRERLLEEMDPTHPGFTGEGVPVSRLAPGADPVENAILAISGAVQQHARGYAESHPANTTIEEVMADPLSLETLKFMVESGARSVPDMVAAMAAPEAYIGSLTQESGEKRVENNNLTGAPDAMDLLAALPGSVAQAGLERFGGGRLLKGAGGMVPNAAGRIATETGLQGVLGAAEEGAGYAGETIGTERGFKPEDFQKVLLAGALSEAGMGTVAQTIHEAQGGPVYDQLRERNQGAIDRQAADLKKARPKIKPDQVAAYDLAERERVGGEALLHTAPLAVAEAVQAIQGAANAVRPVPSEPGAPSTAPGPSQEVSDPLAPRVPETPALEPGVTLAQLQAEHDAAQTNETKATAAARIAAFKQQESQRVQAEAEEGPGQEGGQAGQGQGPGRVPGQAAPDQQGQVTGDRAALESPIGQAAQAGVARMKDPPRLVVHSTHDTIPADIQERAKSIGGLDDVEAFYDEKNDTIHVVSAGINDATRAEWVIDHEVGHVILRSSVRRQKTGLSMELRKAHQNPTVAAVVESMTGKRPERGTIAIEEAVVELLTAYRRGGWDFIETEYGVTVPEAVRGEADSVLARLWERIKNALSHAVGRKFTDVDLRKMLERAEAERDVDQRVNSGKATAPVASRAGAKLDFAPSTKNKRAVFGNTTISYHVNDAGVKLTLLRTGPEGRGKGGARAALQEFLAAADEAGLPVQLTAAPLDARTDEERLKGFYRSEGFEDDANAGVEGVMKRPAKQAPVASRKPLTPSRTTSALLRDLTPAEQTKITDKVAEKIVGMMKALPSHKEKGAVAIAAKAKRGWYAESTKVISAVFGPDAPRFVGLLAALSPQTSVEANLANALSTWKNWRAAGSPSLPELSTAVDTPGVADAIAHRKKVTGGYINLTQAEAIELLAEKGVSEAAYRVGRQQLEIMGRSVQGGGTIASVLPAWQGNAHRVLNHPEANEKMLSGPKVDSFMRNLLGDMTEVTNDAWMANYAAVDQKIFSGRLSKTDAGKGPGYLAMSALARRTARYLTQLTGETWTPAEVQETVWSWSKTLYELADSANEFRTAEELVADGEITDELISSTPDFGTLFTQPDYARILQEAGYGDQLEGIQRARADAARPAGQEPGAGGKAAAVAPEAAKHLRNAARRLDALRKSRAEPARADEDVGDVPFSRRPTINIGLDIPTGGKVKTLGALASVRALGVKITDHAVWDSNTEPTLVVQLDRPLTPEEGNSLSTELQQEAIAQRYEDGTGDLFGPKAEAWGPYNPDFFLELSGETAAAYAERVKKNDEALRKAEERDPSLLRDNPPPRPSSIIASRRAITNTPEFKRWFGDSKVVNASGEPLVVYHGTRSKKGINKFIVPAYFTEDTDFASGFGQNATYPVYLSIQNPYMIDGETEGRHFMWDKKDVADFKRRGFDGVIVTSDSENIYAVFDQAQIKSVNNSGAFDSDNPSIVASRGRPRPFDSKTFGKTIIPAAQAAERSLSQRSKDALDGFQRGVFNKGNAIERDAEVQADIERVFAPVRELLRETFGDTVKLYRAQNRDTGSGERSMLSWSFSTEGKKAGAGAFMPRTWPKRSDDEIERIITQLRDRGHVTVGGNRYVRSNKWPEAGDDYFMIYDRYGSVVTDMVGLKSLRDSLKWDNDFADEQNAERKKDLYAADVPVEQIKWIMTDALSTEAVVARDPAAEGDSIVASRPWHAKKPQPDAVTVTAVHYSTSPSLKQIDPKMAGSGGASAERRRFGMGTFGKSGGTAARVNLYVQDGDELPQRERGISGLGEHPYRVTLDNLYDLDADPRGLASRNADAQEEAISDAGFDGYVAGKQPGIDSRVAVVFDIGSKKIPVEPVDADIVAQRVYHGTPHTVDKFSLQKIGTGEGAQAFGWGLYFAGRKELADYYRDTISKRRRSTPSLTIDGDKVVDINEPSLMLPTGERDKRHARDAIHGLTRDEAQAIFVVLDRVSAGKDGVALLQKSVDQTREWIAAGRPQRGYNDSEPWGLVWSADGSDAEILDDVNRIEKLIPRMAVRAAPKGNTYAVEIPEDDELLWYDQRVEEMPDGVQAAVARAFDFMLEDEREDYFDRMNVDSEKELTGKEVMMLLKRASAHDGLKQEAMHPAWATRHVSSEEETSHLLFLAGIPGLRFEDRASRGKPGNKTYNYVLWDENQISEPEIVASRPGVTGIANARARQQGVYTAVAAQGVQQGSPSQLPNGRLVALRDGIDHVREKLQDKMLRVLRLQQAAGTPAGAATRVSTGTGVADMMDAYTLENLMHGRAADQLKQADRDFVLKLTHAMRRTGVSVEQLQDVLLALHAPERNAKIATINQAFPDAGSGISTADARGILAGTVAGPYSGKVLTPDVIAKARNMAAIVQQMRHRTLDILEQSHQITPQLAATLRSTYQHYVPLRGLAIDDVFPDVMGTGKGLSHARPKIKRALGRNTLAQNILGEAIGDLQRAIVQAEKARVTQAFLRFAIANPMPDMFTVSPVDLEWKFSDATGEAYLAVRSELEDADRSMVVPLNGKPVRIRFEDPRLRDAMMNLSITDMGGFVKIFGAINRWRSAVLTRFNPGFAPVNLVRDAIFGFNAVSAELGPKIMGQTIAGYGPATYALLHDSVKPTGNANAANKTWADWAREYTEAGAKTGLAQAEQPADLQKQLSIASTTIMRLAAQGKPIRAAQQALVRAGTPLVHAIEHVNDATENALRLSVYVALRKRGDSVQSAAEYAKNVTINFNRKGHYGPVINSLYLFYNASMQGSHAVFRVIKKPQVQATLAFFAGLQYLLAASMMGDDDDDGITDWDAIPDYVKRTSFVIPLNSITNGRRDYFALPMPYGFNLFPYMGGRLAQWVNQGSRPTDSSMAADMVKSATEAFSPVPVDEGYSSIFGDQVAFLLELAKNEDDLGRKIVQESGFEQYDVPNALKGRADTPRAYQAMSQILAKIGGGDLDKRIAPVGYLDIAPEQIEAVVGYLTGGPGNLLNKGAKWWDQLDAGNLKEPMDVIGAAPIASRFVDRPEIDKVVAERYYGERGEIARNMDVMKEKVRRGVDPERALAEAQADEPGMAGVDFARYKRAGKKGQQPGDIKRSETGAPQVQAKMDSSFEMFKDAEKVNEDIARAIRNLRSPTLTNADAKMLMDAAFGDYSAAEFNPEYGPDAAPASNRTRQRAIKALQEKRRNYQRAFLVRLRRERAK